MTRRLTGLSGALLLMSLSAVYAPAQTPEPEGDVPEEREIWQKDEPAPEMNAPETGMGVQSKFREKKIHVRTHHMGDRKFSGDGAMPVKRFVGEAAGFLTEDQLLAIIKKHDPKFAETLAGLRETAPAERGMALMMSRKLLETARRENDEKIEADAVREVSLEYDTKKLSRKYDGASDADKAAVKAELKVRLSELFDLRLRSQQTRVRKMEKELVKLKKNMEARKAAKDKIVQDRLGQMTGEGFGW